MKGKLAKEAADKIFEYLDENGKYDIRKSESRRMKLKIIKSSKIPLWSKFDFIRNKELNEISAINNLVNTIFKK